VKQRRDTSLAEIEMLPMTTITLPAHLDSVTRGLALVVQCAMAAGFSPQRVMEIELVVEEALANICLYAYPESSGEVEVRCTQDETRHFLIELIDSGIPFDMLARPAPDLSVDAAQRQPGGLGIPLIRALMDNVTYHREGARNILRLTALLPL
jgi:anti-sigma regulatory factor (Ser/Thr protein kinase)